MRSSIGSALLTAVFIATPAIAQDTTTVRRASAFDLGFYVGGSWAGDVAGDALRGQGAPLSRPALGASATYWTDPRIGVRFNYGYFASPLLTPDAQPLLADYLDVQPQTVDKHFYDLDLVFRPFVARTDMAKWLASTYLFLGGGGLTMNRSGAADAVCSEQEAVVGCDEVPTVRTLGQGVLGGGLDLVPLSRSVGLFGEFSLRGYESPFSAGGPWGGVAATGPNWGNDRFALTPRLLAGIKLGLGDLLSSQPAEPLPPPPAPAPLPLSRVRQPTPVARCQTDGDAAGRRWFIRDQAVAFGDRRWVKFGLPVTLAADQVERIAEYDGVPVFATPGAADAPETAYLPFGGGCEFQPYRAETSIRARG
jgi:hypothetical protein